MELQTTLIAEFITIILGVFALYSVVTKPMKDSIDGLTQKISDMTTSFFDVKLKVEKIDESVKSSHKRIDKLEGK